ncbi:MAG: hypothetical protein NC331_06460 [Lachnospiraceae bacterium]|nr:hypothetical protein [Lachnospiraceae bacterium]MCM1239013.1 hypothetical protein [Lachnospiraceae bacterium]
MKLLLHLQLNIGTGQKKDFLLPVYMESWHIDVAAFLCAQASREIMPEELADAQRDQGKICPARCTGPHMKFCCPATCGLRSGQGKSLPA